MSVTLNPDGSLSIGIRVAAANRSRVLAAFASDPGYALWRAENGNLADTLAVRAAFLNFEVKRRFVEHVRALEHRAAQESAAASVTSVPVED
jgi:hypothetical protein